VISIVFFYALSVVANVLLGIVAFACASTALNSRSLAMAHTLREKRRAKKKYKQP